MCARHVREYVELVVANNNDPPLLRHNDGGDGNHFVSFKLVGTRSNRDAMAARVRLTAGGITQIREVAGGSSYLSGERPAGALRARWCDEG